MIAWQGETRTQAPASAADSIACTHEAITVSWLSASSSTNRAELHKVKLNSSDL